ncbi:sulfite reductase (NADPH) hemoprotein beta-component [Stella humosa]|uniref:Sulfite reductase (NADPH) hemoprotein beta-component n=1 Tax=Stella humosa TaxID=94 RepID=A0A3N1KVE7_9PROT|nr:nitrite/sulfite reductase [Stella humosa]ROP81295.1 sulfite reductase (NADPH) hemoprotein beta-component [Stella humosa]BBK32644.1 sulfite reductase [Stella humosa]
MYRYDDFDRAFLEERVAQFRDQVARRLAGDLNEDEFKPLRLMNGLYLQLHAYMLRIAIPYGTLSSLQMRRLAEVAQRWDRGYGHFTTRQNIQLNWIRLEDAPDIIAALAEVDMHGIQTSGNCIRNVTADQYAGVAADEIEDPRIWAEILRQWSTNHPEFSFLPRKFKIAVTGAELDRAAIRVHDIGLRMCRAPDGSTGFEVVVGGGLGRTPLIGKTIRDFLPKDDLLGYLEAVMRVYNALGRRDNLYKARVKILVHDIGAERMAAMVDEEFQAIQAEGGVALDPVLVARIQDHFAPPAYAPAPEGPPEVLALERADPAFARWRATNTAAHREPGYVIVNLSLKPHGRPPGDATSGEMRAVADMADRWSLGEIRVAHEQNLVLPHVRQADLPDLWRAAAAIGFATPNIGHLTDIIACPGMDYCALATARSIPIAERLADRFKNLDRLHDIGPFRINISGCINACGHHHVGHVGLLGVDKNGEEFYQITLGGSAEEDTAIGRIVGPAVSSADVVDAIERLVETYVDIREAGETFLETCRRVGNAPFKESIYAAA